MLPVGRQGLPGREGLALAVRPQQQRLTFVQLEQIGIRHIISVQVRVQDEIRPVPDLGKEVPDLR